MRSSFWHVQQLSGCRDGCSHGPRADTLRPLATPWGGSGAMRRRRRWQRTRLRRGRCRRSGASALRRTIPDPSVAATITAISTGGVAAAEPAEEPLWRDD
ncbi:hypothetical protein BHM03_00030476 [Ensete ventricosum]|nr:hypothetical protein BHM03_00030476 [Ensete ventricosum]